MDVARLMPNGIANVTNILVALIAMGAFALTHWIEHYGRAAMRTAERWRRHLLAFADQLGWIAYSARLLGRQAGASAVVDVNLTVV